MWKATGFPAGGTKPFWEQLKAQRTTQQTPAMYPMAMATQQFPYLHANAAGNDANHANDGRTDVATATRVQELVAIRGGGTI